MTLENGRFRVTLTDDKDPECFRLDMGTGKGDIVVYLNARSMVELITLTSEAFLEWILLSGEGLLKLLEDQPARSVLPRSLDQEWG